MSNISNFVETMEAAEKFYETSMHNYAAKTLDYDGFTARLDFEDKQYWTVSRIDKDAELVIMEISPSIICLSEARSQLSEYITAINNKYKIGNIRISSNGALHIHSEQRFDDAPLSSDMFRVMEGACIKILDTFYTPLKKLANCKLITAEEADVDTVILNHDEKIKSKLKELESEADSLLSRLKRKKQTANNDDSNNDDDFELPEPPGFSAWLERKRKELENKSSDEIDDSEKCDKTESSDSSENKSLLDVLLGIPEEATLEEIEASLDISDADDSDKSSDD